MALCYNSAPLRPLTICRSGGNGSCWPPSLILDQRVSLGLQLVEQPTRAIGQRRSHQLVGEMFGRSSDVVATSREGHHQPISDLAVQHPLRTLEPLQRLRLMRVKPSRTQKYL